VRMAQIAEPYMARPVEPELLEGFGRDAATIGRAALEGTLDAVTATSFIDRLGSITTTTLVVGGSGDPMFAAERPRRRRIRWQRSHRNEGDEPVEMRAVSRRLDRQDAVKLDDSRREVSAQGR
jgi:hypothetical protein